MGRVTILLLSVLGMGSPALALSRQRQACPSCDSIARCREDIDKHQTAGLLDICRAGLALKLGSLYLDAGEHESAVELYKREARDGNLVAFDRLKALGTPYSLPWTPLRLTLYPDSWTWPKRPAVYGISFGPLIAQGALNVGVQAGGLAAFADRHYGIQFAILGACSRRVSGAQGAFGVSLADRVNGIQLGLFNFQREAAFGIQVGGINFGNLSGLQIGAANASGELKGIQIGAVNGFERTTGPLVGHVQGLQIGLMNNADRVEGAQIGLYNDCNSLRGLQLGLINRATESKRAQWLPVMRLSL